MCSIIVKYPGTEVQGICTASFLHKSSTDFARIEEEKGAVIVYSVTSRPQGFKVELFDGTSDLHDLSTGEMKGLLLWQTETWKERELNYALGRESLYDEALRPN